jgi:hypothetical protein
MQRITTSMTMTRQSLSALLGAGLLLLLLSSGSHAFTPVSMMQKAALASKVAASSQHQRFMAKTEDEVAEDKKETTADSPLFVKSVLKKQMAYDEKAGRFFESNVSEEDCIPDEEFCVTDKDTGDFIRLTQAEKERIFLDSLQVR